ncbi:MAG: nitronate monooxygenase, partial [Hyphomicrobiales bacterium]
GVPDFKIEKTVVERRVAQMAAEGVELRCGVEVGRDVTVAELRGGHDAVVTEIVNEGPHLLSARPAQGVVDQQPIEAIQIVPADIRRTPAPQGHEAGGHTGEITTMVLVPEVVDAVAPIPVLAAGGIGRGRQFAAALALGAEGVWCGSIWLTTRESDADPVLRKRLLAARSSDTVRTRSFTGKPARFLKSAWTDAWESPAAPTPLMRPLQYFLRTPAFARIDRAQAEPFVSSPIGQIVGHMNEEPTVRQVYYDLLSEFGDTVERMRNLLE